MAARLAGQHAMEQMNYVQAVKKSETELVTQADAECQQIIIQRIRETYPDHGFIAEEGEKGRLFKRPPLGEPAIWWAIDPIDGTNNFAHGIPIFAVSVAALYEGEPIVGVIFQPATEHVHRRQGRRGPVGRQAHRRRRAEIGPITSVGLDSHFDDELPPWACEIIRVSRFRNFGTTALHMAYVARGGLVANVVCTPKLWDIAAGVDCRGGRGRHYRLEGREALPDRSRRLRGPGLPHGGGEQEDAPESSEDPSRTAVIACVHGTHRVRTVDASGARGCTTKRWQAGTPGMSLRGGGEPTKQSWTRPWLRLPRQPLAGSQ